MLGRWEGCRGPHAAGEEIGGGGGGCSVHFITTSCTAEVGPLHPKPPNNSSSNKTPQHTVRDSVITILQKNRYIFTDVCKIILPKVIFEPLRL